MWTGKIAVLFLLKSHKETKNLDWKILLSMTFLSDFLMLFFVLIGLEQYSLDSTQINLVYSNSLYSVLMIFILSLMICEYYKEDALYSFIYSGLPIIGYCLNLIAFPRMPLTWNSHSFIEGLDLYNYRGVRYIAFIVELSFVLIAYIVYRKQNPFPRESKAPKAEKENESEVVSEDKLDTDDNMSPPLYSPFTGWMILKKLLPLSIKHKKEGGTQLIFNNNDFEMILVLFITSLPILMGIFF